MSSSDLVRAMTPYVRRARRQAFLQRVRLLAAAAGSTVDLDVALDVQVGRRVTVTVDPGTHTTVSMGPECRIGDGVVLDLKGGRLELEGWDNLRRGVVVNVAGHLSVGRATVLGAGTHVHCAEHVRIGHRTSIGEYSTIVDSTHVFTVKDQPPWEVLTTPVSIGDDCFLGAKSTVPRGASVGHFCVVGASSVVVGHVPDRTFVSGVPAVRVKGVTVPWEV